MTRGALATRSFALLVVVLAVTSCAFLPSESNRRKPVAITFSRAASVTAFPGAYVSVLDTAVLSISYSVATRTAPGNLTQTLRAPVGERDSVIVFEADLDTGLVTFSASILSNNGTRVFSGSLTTQMKASTDSVTIPLIALTPAMVLSLQFPFTDGLVPSGVAALNRRTFTATVYNRGRDSLTWISQTNLQTCACTFSVTTGKVAAGQSGQVLVAVVTASQATAPATPPRITLSSTQGRVVTP